MRILFETFFCPQSGITKPQRATNAGILQQPGIKTQKDTISPPKKYYLNKH